MSRKKLLSKTLRSACLSAQSGLIKNCCWHFHSSSRKPSTSVSCCAVTIDCNAPADFSLPVPTSSNLWSYLHLPWLIPCLFKQAPFSTVEIKQVAFVCFTKPQLSVPQLFGCKCLACVEVLFASLTPDLSSVVFCGIFHSVAMNCISLVALICA